jgi:hypothetical protein
MFGKKKPTESLLPQKKPNTDILVKQLEIQIQGCEAAAAQIFEPLRALRVKMAVHQSAIDFEKNHFGGKDMVAIKKLSQLQGQTSLVEASCKDELKRSKLMEKIVELNEKKALLLAAKSSPNDASHEPSSYTPPVPRSPK